MRKNYGGWILDRGSALPWTHHFQISTYTILHRSLCHFDICVVLLWNSGLVNVPCHSRTPEAMHEYHLESIQNSYRGAHKITTSRYNDMPTFHRTSQIYFYAPLHPTLIKPHFSHVPIKLCRPKHDSVSFFLRLISYLSLFELSGIIKRFLSPADHRTCDVSPSLLV